MAPPTATRQAFRAAWLEAVMRRQGLSVRHLALRAGVPVSVVQKLSAGEGRQTSVWTLAQLADTLAGSLDGLGGRANSNKGHGQSLPTGEEAPPQGEMPTTPQPPAQRQRTRTAAPAV